MKAVRTGALVALAVLLAYVTARKLGLGDKFTIERTRPVVSDVDGAKYRVHPDTGGKQAANLLATMNERVVDLMRYLRQRYLRSDDGNFHVARRAAVKRLLQRYNPDNLAENSPLDPSGDTSYTIDKGKLVALCLRERDPAAAGDPATHDLHDLSTLTFVTLHEMSHIAIDAIDHPPEFWSVFRFLLEAAEEAGVYSSPDYRSRPVKYCGVRIDYNPRWDAATIAA